MALTLQKSSWARKEYKFTYYKKLFILKQAMKDTTEKHIQSIEELSSFYTKRSSLSHKIFACCGGKSYFFFLAILFISGTIAGALLAHMSIKAEATTSPYLFSGSIVRMPINTSRVTGEQPTTNISHDTLQKSKYPSLKRSTVHQKVRYTFMDNQNETSVKKQEAISRGLLSFDNGVVSILTDTENTPVRLTPTSSSMTPFFAFNHGDNNGSSYHAYTERKSLDYEERVSFTTPFSLSLFQCAIQTETKRNGLQKFMQKFMFNPSSTSIAMRSSKYRHLVERYASKYRLAPELILGIIRTESNFNPYAISQSQAFGLMQIVPTTAGGEVYNYLTGQEGIPTPDILFEPEKNIQYGTVYLHLLNTRYFQGVSNKDSRRLLMIAAYNGGPGAVLHIFSQDQGEAIAIINGMTPDLVYKELIEKMPHMESRLYVDRVLSNMQSFANS